MMPGFQRPHRIRVINNRTGEERGDGWYFVAFWRAWRVRGWKLYEWTPANVWARAERP